MNVILLQTTLLSHEIDLLLKEFPQFLFLSLSEAAYKNLSPEYWSSIEVIFGARLTKEELHKASQLHWIHSPTANLSRLCLDEIENTNNLLVSNTVEENSLPIGEFVIGSVLAFAKNLFAWKEMQGSPSHLWDSKWRDSMLSLQNKIFLQVGLTRPAGEIARQARHFNMRVWGIEEKPTFHPHYHKIFSYGNLKVVLSQADVICVHYSKNKKFQYQIQKEHLEWMKEGAILILLGSSPIGNEEEFAEIAQTGKFRGILIDASYQNPINLNSSLWKIPELIITPEVSPRPKSAERLAFRIFLYNLRQYVYGNYKDMRNITLSTFANRELVLRFL